jgi:DNA-binding IclR family transcriptional regulator
MEQRATSYHSQGLARALTALKALSAAGRPLTLAELSRAMELPKSTLIRLLSVMEEQDFVRREGNPPTYTIGHSVLEIAQAYKPGDVADVAAPLMRELAGELGFTANLGVLEGRSVLHLHVEEPPRALRFAASGTLDFTYCTGLGKMLMSTLPDGQLDEHLPAIEPFTPFTPQTITTFAGMRAELVRVRERGYSIDDQERNRGVTCLAVLVPVEGAVPVSLSISAPTGELLADADQQACLQVVRGYAARLAGTRQFTAAFTAFVDKASAQ